MKKLGMYTVITCFMVLIISCNNEQVIDEIPTEDYYDAEIESDGYFMDSIMSRNPAAQGFVDEPEKGALLEYESIIGVWVCYAGKAIEFEANGEFVTHDIYTQPGEWYIEDEVLVISLTDDTIKFWIDELTNHRMVIDSVYFGNWHEFLCETGSNYMIYNTFYKDKPIELPVVADYVGTWYGGDGYDIHADWSYDYIGPHCLGGKWDVDEENLFFYDDDCGTTKLTVKALSKHRLQLETGTYFRVPEEGGMINTSKSE